MTYYNMQPIIDALLPFWPGNLGAIIVMIVWVSSFFLMARWLWEGKQTSDNIERILSVFRLLFIPFYILGSLFLYAYLNECISF